MEVMVFKVVVVAGGGRSGTKAVTPIRKLDVGLGIEEKFTGSFESGGPVVGAMAE